MATNVHNGYLNTSTWAPSSSEHLRSLVLNEISDRAMNFPILTGRDALSEREPLHGVLPAP